MSNKKTIAYALAVAAVAGGVYVFKSSSIALPAPVASTTISGALEKTTSPQTAPAAASPTLSAKDLASDKVFFASRNKEYFDSNGIARKWAGFFVRNTAENRARFAVGNVVVFKNNEKRTIAMVGITGPYLELRTDGGIIESDKVGSPSEFTIIKKEKSTDAPTVSATSSPKKK